MDAKAQTKAYIEEAFLFGQGELEEETSLIEEHIIDSTGILEVIAFVERAFHVRVADDEMVPENFDSVRAIADYVKRKTGT